MRGKNQLHRSFKPIQSQIPLIIKKYMIQQTPQNSLQTPQNTNNPSKKPQQNPVHQYTPQQQKLYQDIMSNWKANQRTSISKRYEYENIYTANPDLPHYGGNTPGDNSDIVDEKTNLFVRYTSELSNYLKSRFVIEEVVEQLEQQKMVDITEHKIVEFMYLLAFRAWCDISFALHTFQKFQYKSQNGNSQVFVKGKQNLKASFSNPQQQNLKILIAPMFKLLTKAEKCLSFYHKALSLRQSTFRNQMKKFYYFIFHHSKKSFRDKILFGVEGLDYTRDEQIQYTQDNWVDYIRKQLLDCKGQQALKMRGLIKAYPKIMKIQLHKLQSFDAFENLKISIIKQQQTKISTKIALV